MENGRFAFLSPSGGLGATYDVHLRLIGKRIVDLAGGFSDLEMTWLLYCAGTATAKCGQWRLATRLLRRRRRQRVVERTVAAGTQSRLKNWVCPSSLLPTLLPALPPSFHLCPSIPLPSSFPFPGAPPLEAG